MRDKRRMQIKGNRYGINVFINMNAYRDMDEMIEELIDNLNRGRRFYEGSTINIITQLDFFNRRQINRLKDILFHKFKIKDCVFEEHIEEANKVFTGIYEGRTKFINRTIRSGQVIKYNGNIVIIGDVNPGAEICASGNVVVFGKLKGQVHAGDNGNERAIIAALSLQPKVLRIANVITRAPEDNEEPNYPEIAKIKKGTIIVEPYIPNKYL